MLMKIGEISRKLGITTRTLRYYEQLKLIQPDKKTHSGYRYYDSEKITAIRRIRELQNVGLSLQEIRNVIGLYTQPSKKIEAKRVLLRYIQDHLDEVNRKIEVLETMRRELQRQKKITQVRLKKITEEKKK